MANGLKRMLYAEEAGFQKRVGYYYWQRASQVLLSASPDSTDLALAKAIYAGRVSRLDMCLSVVTVAAIGNAIDNEGIPTDAQIETAVVTEDRFHLLALAYQASGVIGA